MRRAWQAASTPACSPCWWERPVHPHVLAAHADGTALCIHTCLLSMLVGTPCASTPSHSPCWWERLRTSASDMESGIGSAQTHPCHTACLAAS
eukprot:354490-Chlamydomonas_euryale.AAC.2